MQQFVTVAQSLDTLLRLHAGSFMFLERLITGGQPVVSAIAPEQMNRSQRSLSRFTKNLPTRATAVFVMSWHAIMT